MCEKLCTTRKQFIAFSLKRFNKFALKNKGAFVSLHFKCISLDHFLKFFDEAEKT